MRKICKLSFCQLPKWRDDKFVNFITLYNIYPPDNNVNFAARKFSYSSAKRISLSLSALLISILMNIYDKADIFRSFFTMTPYTRGTCNSHRMQYIPSFLLILIIIFIRKCAGKSRAIYSVRINSIVKS